MDLDTSVSSRFTLLFNKLLPKLASTWYLPEIESPPHKDTTFLSTLKDLKSTFLSTLKHLTINLCVYFMTFNNQGAAKKTSENYNIWRNTPVGFPSFLWLLVAGSARSSSNVGHEGWEKQGVIRVCLSPSLIPSHIWHTPYCVLSYPQTSKCFTGNVFRVFLSWAAK